MINVSENFKTAMKQPIKELQAYIDYGDSKITDADDLHSFKISCNSSMCKTAMRKVEAKYFGDHNLLGKWVHVGYGVKTASGTFEYLDYGSFLVSEISYSKDTETTTITGYDKMVSSMTEYNTIEIEYPISLKDYTKLICEASNLELGSVLLGHNAEIDTDATTLTDAYETELIEAKLNGNVEQETTEGRNCFTIKNKTIFNSGITKIEEISTGIRATAQNNNSASFGLVVLEDLSNYVGKTIRMKSNFTPSSQNKGNYIIGLCNSTGSSRTSKARSSESGTIISFTVPALTDTKTYLGIWFYSNNSGTANIGDYVDYTDIIVTIDNEDMSYEPYTNGASPNPEYPQEVEVVDNGWNLINLKPTINITNSGVNITVDEQKQKVKFNGTLTNTYCNSNKLYFDEPINEGIYSFTFNSECNSFIWLRGESNVLLRSIQSKRPKNHTIDFSTLAEPVTNIEFGIEDFTIGDTVNIEAGYQMTKSTTALPYLPYGSIGLRQTGKNEFNPQKAVLDSNQSSIYITEDGKYIRYITSAKYLAFYPENIKENTQYKFTVVCKNANATTNQIGFSAFYTDGTRTNLFLNSINDTNEHIFSGVTESNKTLEYLRSVWSNDAETFLKIEGTMLKEVDVGDDTYEPYFEPKVHKIDLKGNEMLTDDELVQDYNGNTKLVKKWGKVVLNGSETFVNSSFTSARKWWTINFANYGIYKYTDPSVKSQLLAPKFRARKQNGAFMPSEMSMFANYEYEVAFVFEPDATEEQARAILKDMPVYFKLATPQEIDLGVQTPLKLLAGENNISVLANLEPSTKEFTYYKSLDNLQYNKMNEYPVTKELWENISGITYRDILQQIAQATASTCIISNDDKVYFKPLTQTNENLTYDNMFKLKLEEKYGEINSVVLSRTPAEDNIYRRDEASITANGLTEFKIENNEIIDKDRDTAMDSIYPALKGISYYPFETTTEGLGWYEIGDKFTIINDTEDEFSTALFNVAITIDGSIKETLKTTAETKTQTQYQYASQIAKRIKNTEIIVDKQEQYIEDLVTDMYSEDGVINENFTKIHQDINNIVNNVQNSGGNNIIKNSVMFAYDDSGIPNDWTIEGDGQLSIDTNSESMSVGALSGHSFTLENKKATQTVQVKKDDSTIAEENKTYYTFSTRIKKATTGSCYIKIFNSVEEYNISVPVGTNTYYKEYELKLLPKDTYYTIEFYGSADSEATFTDNMLAIGSYKSQWTQANGEIMNTQVNVNVNGVLVKSSVYLGDYTIMSPLEFAGYSKLNGVITRVFSLNKDTTKVTKLQAENEVKMVPLKIVPITSGDLQGWAFVPTTE